jgi:ABC-type sugar transport system, periplasmic component
MKLNLKKTLPVLLFVSLLGLSACGDPKTSDASSTAASSTAPTSTSSTTSSVASSASSGSSEKVEITFWHTMGHNNATLLDNMISRFQAKYPNITVNATSAAGSYDDLESLILSAIPANTTPTMAFCYPDHVAEYIEKNKAVVDLTSFMNDPEIGFQESDGSHKDNDGNVLSGKDDYVKSFWDEGSSYTTSGVYSVPFAKSTEALFYNKTVFDQKGWEVPQTWDQMWDLCATIRAAYPDKGADGKYTYYPLGYDSDSNMYITLSQQMGIPFTSATGDHYLFNNDQAKDMVRKLKTNYDAGYFVTKGTSANSTFTSTKFTAGEILMSIGSTGGTTYNQTGNFTVGVAVPPSIDLDKPAVISQGPSICFFNQATAAQKRAAWLFYRFISTAENSTYYAVSTGYQPVRTSSYSTAIYTSFVNAAAGDRTIFNDVASTTLNMQTSYFNSPVFVGSAKARNEMTGLMSSVLLGSKTVDNAFNDAMSNCLNG